jgi:hypothetical protein
MRHPGQGDFISAGLGIQERYRRCKPYWDPHLSLTKDFIAKTVSACRPGSVTILGAGRLLDVPLESISDERRTVTFIDYDPSVKSSWDRAARQLSTKNVATRQHFLDVTGRLELWSERLNLLPRHCSAEHSSQLLEALASTPQQITSLEKLLADQDMIISLNLLSQIPLYWEDRVKAALSHLSTGDETILPETVNATLRRLMLMLQQEHLELLANSKAKNIIVVSDVLFHYYTQDCAHWQTEDALFLPSELSLTNYRQHSRDRWLWHLAPQWLERQDYGEIHTVAAWHFARGSN